MFDVDLRPAGEGPPFGRQLPVFNWFYPFDVDADREPQALAALASQDWSAVARRAAYIHVPFCETICGFCPFTRGRFQGDGILKRYLQALTRELQLKRPYLGRLAVDSIFIGGGTPSVLLPEQIEQLGEAIHLYLDASAVQEFAVEVEVKSVTREKLLAMKRIGVNRLSVGAQTFAEPHRRAFNLDATVEQVRRVVGWANEIFPYTNIDVIYGIAGQDANDVLADAEAAVSLATTTVDFYPLNNVAAQARMHDALREEGFARLSAVQRMAQRRLIAEYMLARQYARINGYSYARKAGSSTGLIQHSPRFLYHDILYGHDDDGVIGYGASAITQLPGWNVHNAAVRADYTKVLLERDTLPSVAYRVPEGAGKGVVTFPYRGVLRKERVAWDSVSPETGRALEQLVQSGLAEEYPDRYQVTEAGWLYYVNMMYFLMPVAGKKWISDRIATRLAAGHECETTELV
jgi:coproporphyrinogen III oxidase-like Fe-S oxidoreductase